MANLGIVTNPAKMLAQSARKVARSDIARDRQLVEDMTETMLEGGGLGLAANQVGELLRVVVVRDLESDEVNYYLNPTITEGHGEEISEEGCLSFPGLAGLVPRFESVTAKFQDLDLNTYKVELEGLPARTLQHEIDHLNGITIKDRSTVELYHPQDEEEESPRLRRRRRAVIN